MAVVDKRTKHRSTKSARVPRATRATRASRADQFTKDGVDTIFQDLLADTSADDISKARDISLTANEEIRPLKRRRVGPVQKEREKSQINEAIEDQDIAAHGSDFGKFKADNSLNKEAPRQFVIDHSDTSDDSDIEWEDVGQQINNNPTDQKKISDEEKDDKTVPNDLAIVFDKSPEARKHDSKQRRKIRTVLERNLRINVHKTHILCLLAHEQLRNSWCNDRLAQASLKSLLPPRIVTNLNLDPNASQFQQSHLFSEGLSSAARLWNSKFQITTEGMKKPNWMDLSSDRSEFSISTNNRDPVDRDEFKKSASDWEGSQDLGAQLFCCLLRSVGVDARLVCSLQPLDFASRPAASSQSSKKETIYAYDNGTNAGTNKNKSRSVTPTKKYDPSSNGRIRRFGRTTASKIVAGTRHVAPPQRRSLSPIQYPVFWVEALNVASQKWVSVNPFGDSSVCRPSTLEPPLSYGLNSLTYVIAFNKDGSAKDVTRRYAKTYNAKTRKHRIESTPDGELWWMRTMRVYRRRKRRGKELDQLEDAELARKEAAEGLPRNVQDFKNHPYYVLERHLRRNEIIHPKNEVGKVGVGGHASTTLESIYRRRDVHIVRSADKWYRLGREIKEGEQPLKYLTSRNTAQSRVQQNQLLNNEDDPDEDDDQGRALYAHFQTTLYVAPPVVRGHIPRNDFGNLDIYVPSMVPPGGVHIRHHEAARAARLLGIDYADAITGFQFKGRRGTAVNEGVVVAEEFVDATWAVIDGFVKEAEERDDRKRRGAVLRMWKKFLTGLRIVQRVGEYGEDMDAHQSMSPADETEDDEHVENHRQGKGNKYMPDAENGYGGFLLEGAVETIPTANSKRYTLDLFAGNVMEQNSESDGGILPFTGRHDVNSDHKSNNGAISEGGGGFLIDEDMSGDTDKADGIAPNVIANIAKESHTSAPVSSREMLERKVEIESRQIDHQFNGPNHNTFDEMQTSEKEASSKDIVRESGTSNSAIHQPTPPVASRRLSVQSKAITNQEECTITPTTVAQSEVKASGSRYHEVVKEREEEHSQGEESDKSERGSLFSEDPDDEDAEPEWLAGGA